MKNDSTRRWRGFGVLGFVGLVVSSSSFGYSPGMGNMPLPVPGRLPIPAHQWKRLPPPQLKKQKLPRPVPRANDPADVEAAAWVGRANEGLDCEQLGETLRRISNRVLAEKETRWDPKKPSRPTAPGRIPPARPNKRAWIQSDEFWERVWSHLSDTYRSCEVDCFEDGYAVGQISGQAYCGVSVALEGLDAPGYRAQGPLPVCENSIFVGCLNGFRDSTRSDESCREYLKGKFAPVAKQFQSQDCHID